MYVAKPNIMYTWSNMTFIFYLAIAICSFILPNFFIVKVTYRNRIKEVPLGIIFTSMILIFTKAFSIVGTDALNGYYINFMGASSLSTFPDYSVEIGFRLLTIIIHNIWNNYTFYLFIISFLTIFPIAHLSWKYRENIIPGIVFGVYASIYYIQSFSLLRIYLASSILLYFFDFLKNKKYIKALMVLLIAGSIHITSLIFFAIYGLKLFKKFSAGIDVVILIIFGALMGLVSNKIPMLFEGRYSVYKGTTSSGFGVEQLLYILPIFILFFYGINKYERNSKIDDITFLVITYNFIIGQISYLIPIFGRITNLFLINTFIISYYAKIVEKYNKYQSIVIYCLIIVYSVVRMVIYLNQYYNIDEIMPYQNIFGWAF